MTGLSRGDDEAQAGVVGVEPAQVAVTASQAPDSRSARSRATTRSTTAGSVRAKPEVAARAAGSSTRSGWAQNAANVQSGVSAGTSIVRTDVSGPSHSVSRSIVGKIRRSSSATSGR